MKRVLLGILVLALLGGGTLACVRAYNKNQIPEQPVPISEEAEFEASPGQENSPEQKQPDRADASTPEGAVTAWMEDVVTWNVDALPTQAEAYVSRETLEAYGSLAGPLLELVEYDLGNSKITGNKAEVDMAVTVPNVQEAAGKLVTDVLAYATLQKILGKEPDIGAYAAERVTALTEDQTITTTTYQTTVHLIQGGDGEWKLDLSAPENGEFLQSLTDGLDLSLAGLS